VFLSDVTVRAVASGRVPAFFEQEQKATAESSSSTIYSSSSTYSNDSNTIETSNQQSPIPQQTHINQPAHPANPFNMSDLGRKDFTDSMWLLNLSFNLNFTNTQAEASEKMTPDSQKSTTDKASENVTGAYDNVAGSTQPGKRHAPLCDTVPSYDRPPDFAVVQR